VGLIGAGVGCIGAGVGFIGAGVGCIGGGLELMGTDVGVGTDICNINFVETLARAGNVPVLIELTVIVKL
jgi:hypothetical protein